MFTDPVKNLKIFGLRDDMIVADLGAGTGHYSLAAAKMVPRGKVYAIEIQKDFLITIKNKAEEAHLNNLECILGNVEKLGGTKIKDNIIDAAIVSNILFQIEDKNKFIQETKRILKTNGRLLLIDWSLDSPVIKTGAHKIISKNEALEMFKNEGFEFEREIDAGNHHYGIILIKK